MSDPVAEQPLLAAAFRALLKSAYQKGGKDYPRRLEFLGAFADGARYMVEYGDRTLSFYLVTDLLGSKRVEQSGVSSLTIGAFTFTVILNVTLPAALKDVITNYVPIVSIGDSNSPFPQAVPAGQLIDTTHLQLSLRRMPLGILNALTGVSVGGGDLTDVDVTLFNPHGSDSGVGPHGHTTNGHPVTDPQHLHTFNAVGAITHHVNWIIVHL